MSERPEGGVDKEGSAGGTMEQGVVDGGERGSRRGTGWTGDIRRRG